MIVDSVFYEQHNASFETHGGKLIFVNQIPEAMPVSKSCSYIFTGYKSNFLRHIVQKSKRLEDCALFNISGIDFNINGPAKILSKSEYNSFALYVGQTLQRFNNAYRIFEMRHLSIVSFVGDEKNRQLMQVFKDFSIKEIFSQDDGFNLIPGLFNDHKRKTVVLIEDMLINNLASDSFLQQKLFLDKIEKAGLTILSIDNYKLIKGDEEDAVRQFQRLFEATLESISKGKKVKD